LAVPAKINLGRDAQATTRDYRWSSARAHFEGRDDSLVQVEPMLSAVGDRSEYPAQGEDEAEVS